MILTTLTMPLDHTMAPFPPDASLRTLMTKVRSKLPATSHVDTAVPIPFGTREI